MILAIVRLTLSIIAVKEQKNLKKKYFAADYRHRRQKSDSGLTFKALALYSVVLPVVWAQCRSTVDMYLIKG